MKAKMTFKTSYRVTIGPSRTHIGWINSGKNVDLTKIVKNVSNDNSDAVGDLLTGGIAAIDESSPLKTFHIVGEKIKEIPTFLGYFETVKPALASTLLALWPQMQFTAVVK